MRVVAAVVGLLAVTAFVAMASPAAAQSTPQPIENNTTYYDGENGTTNMTGWVPGDGNVTADGLLNLLARIPGIFIGSGGLDPSSSGYQGVLITGAVIVGGTAMAAVGTGVGIVAGAMISMVLAFGLTIVGIVPEWIRPLLLFALVGVPASRAIISVFR